MSDGSSAVGPARPKRLIRKFDADWRLRVTAESFCARCASGRYRALPAVWEKLAVVHPCS
jgi:hypothetical protein